MLFAIRKNLKIRPSLFKIAQVLGYDQMLSLRPWFVDVKEAKEKKLYSTILMIHKIDEPKSKAFDNFWWQKKQSPKSSLKPFHIFGRNCSSFAYHSFEEADLLTKKPGFIETPEKLFHHLISLLKFNYELKCFSGFLGFKPIEDLRRNRVSNKNAKYDIIIEDCNMYDI